MFRAAPNFDQLPIINRTLRNTQVPPEARIQNILEETNSSDWWDAKERYDPTAWQSKPQGAEE
jgi:hypothetical protein